VEAPFYDSKSKASKKDWERRKSAPGAWGCAVGKYVGFCMPRNSFQQLVEPYKILDIYDLIYTEYHKLRGTKP
jgi:hypothetical protein